MCMLHDRMLICVSNTVPCIIGTAEGFLDKIGGRLYPNVACSKADMLKDYAAFSTANA